MNGNEDLDHTLEEGDVSVPGTVGRLFSIERLTDELNRAGFTDVVVEGCWRDKPVNILMLIGQNMALAADNVQPAIERCAKAATGWSVQPGFTMMLNKGAVAATISFAPQ